MIIYITVQFISLYVHLAVPHEKENYIKKLDYSRLMAYTSVRPIIISDIGHIGINPRYRRSDGNCPPISDVCDLKHALYSSQI